MPGRRMGWGRNSSPTYIHVVFEDARQMVVPVLKKLILQWGHGDLQSVV